MILASGRPVGPLLGFVDEGGADRAGAGGAAEPEGEVTTAGAGSEGGEEVAPR
jgi:hypothetical protein